MNTSDLRHAPEDCRPELIRIAFSLLGTREAAEDVAQEALLRHVERFGPGGHETPPDSSRAWLARVARNLAIDRLRRLRLERELRLAGRLSHDVAGPDEPDDELARRERRRDAIRRLLDTVGPRDAAAVLLREVFGVGYADIARGSGRGGAAWRQAVHRALARTRVRTGGDGEASGPRDADAESAGEGVAADGVLERFEGALIERDAAPLFDALRVDADGRRVALAGLRVGDRIGIYPVRRGSPAVSAVPLHAPSFRGRLAFTRLTVDADGAHLSLVLDGRVLCRLTPSAQQHEPRRRVRSADEDRVLPVAASERAGGLAVEP